MDAIKTVNLYKKFSRSAGYRDLLPFQKKKWIVATNNINLNIKEGEFFGLLGPNGAGKTTLVKLLCCLVIPTSGTAEVFGHDIVKDEAEVKKLVGLVTADERSFYWRMTGRENLQFHSALYHMKKDQANKRIDELLDMLEMTDKADIRFQNYSTGMRQKLAIARGLLSGPRILFVDEPTRSLDPVSARNVRQFFKEKVSAMGSTIILATHNMAEAEQLCDRLAIIARGQVRALGSVPELRSVFQTKESCELTVGHFSESILPLLDNIEGVISCHLKDRQNGTSNLELKITNRVAVLPRVLQTMVDNNIDVLDCKVRDLPLDEIFINALHNTKEVPE
ncbi:MAG: ABC transporter ATP-binding protein [Dehalococcoidales bacterium]|jgi:ABC-2 type transport system ATP-binding protein